MNDIASCVSNARTLNHILEFDVTDICFVGDTECNKIYKKQEHLSKPVFCPGKMSAQLCRVGRIWKICSPNANKK